MIRNERSSFEKFKNEPENGGSRGIGITKSDENEPKTSQILGRRQLLPGPYSGGGFDLPARPAGGEGSAGGCFPRRIRLSFPPLAKQASGFVLRKKVIYGT